MSNTFLSLIFFAIINHVFGVCVIPQELNGEFYSLGIDGKNTWTVITDKTVTVKESLNTVRHQGNCEEIRTENQTTDYDKLEQFTVSRIKLSYAAGCYRCMIVYGSTPNILQLQMSEQCQSFATPPDLNQVCADFIAGVGQIILFRTDLKEVNCKNTFEGVFHFTYEVDRGGGGICDSRDSTVRSCQEPGSIYVDNRVFTMQFGFCPNVQSTREKEGTIRFQCMGQWFDQSGNMYAAVADLGATDTPFKYRCLLTRRDQTRGRNEKRWTMSRDAQCSTLSGIYQGPYLLVVSPKVPDEEAVVPTCNLPQNFTGDWFTTSEYDSMVKINNTHIYFKTQLDQYNYRETYFTCKQNRDSRFMMTEVDFVCFDFVARHQNIIRYRMSKPFRAPAASDREPGFMVRMFKVACNWEAFILDQNKTDWKYNMFIMNPPDPVECPVAGRFKFIQHGQPNEFYKTRIRGITERPRWQIQCRDFESDLAVCRNTKWMAVDAERCVTVDQRARMIGEYDISDHDLMCVGNWMEDMRSYLVTYDKEDTISPFRCWVYERIAWRKFWMSRAVRAQCGRAQTPQSSSPDVGASLALELDENERLFDECPVRFNDGRNPYEKPTQIDGTETSAAPPSVSAVSIVRLLVSSVACVSIPLTW